MEQDRRWLALWVQLIFNLTYLCVVAQKTKVCILRSETKLFDLPLFVARAEPSMS